MSPIVVGLENATVSSLRLAEENGWDYDILKDIFIERDINLILNILLSATSRADCWQWLLKRRGTYSIKSAYRYLTSRSTLVFEDVNPIVWNNIWSLQVSSKVKFLVWCACSNCLPIKSALRTRHVDIVEMCLMCNAELEDTLHVLVKCIYAKSVWCQSIIGDRSGFVNNFIS